MLKPIVSNVEWSQDVECEFCTVIGEVKFICNTHDIFGPTLIAQLPLK